MFRAKIRNVGTSMGLLIPKDVAREMRIRVGEEVNVGILKKDKELIKRMFGSAKGAKPFEREHIEREF